MPRLDSWKVQITPMDAEFVRYCPTAPLGRYIACFWWSRRTTVQDYCEHILPSGGVQLLFALHDTPILCLPNSPMVRRIEWTHSLIHGPQGNHYVAGPKPCGTTVGVAFHPGAAGAVLGVGMTDLADDHVSLSALWGRRGEDLLDRLMAAATPKEIFCILEREFSGRLQRSLLVHPAVAHALKPDVFGAQIRVSEIQRESGYSPRHFIALFRTAVGLTPKHYYRIQRFNSVLRRLASGGNGELAQIAVSAGYSDQAHLTRDFREFAGITPTQYRPGGSQRHLHHRASARPDPGPGKESSSPAWCRENRMGVPATDMRL
jgi:AraC-like DNA-binding protein